MNTSVPTTETILTPEKVATFRRWADTWEEYALRGTLAETLDSHEALREQLAEAQADRDSWQATAEVLADKNVNKSLLQRHEMREAALKEQLADARNAVRALVEAVSQPEHSHSHFLDGGHEGCVFCRGWNMRKRVLARPRVKRLLEEQT